MDLELAGKAAIVTGASRGIGKAVARELALEGCDVAVVARGREALEATAAEIVAESGRQVLALTADMSDDASVVAMVKAAHEALGRIDILVNNAASPGSALPPVPLDELTDDHVRADIEVKVLGYLRTARAVAPIMRAQGWGPDRQRLRARGAPRGQHLGQHAQRRRRRADEEPGERTRAARHQRDRRPPRRHPHRAHGGDDRRARSAQGVPEEEIERRLDEGNSIRHLVDAREVAWVVAFLASPKSISINGDAIATGGGPDTAIHY